MQLGFNLLNSEHIKLHFLVHHAHLLVFGLCIRLVIFIFKEFAVTLRQIVLRTF